MSPAARTGKRALVSMVAAGAGLAVLAVFAARDYLGARNYEAYDTALENVRSIQSGLPELERFLLRAVRLAPRRAYLEALGGLYLDAALAESQSGNPEKRDMFLDEAEAVLLREIGKYPAAADGYYSLGRVYMLYNHPLLTYAARGREYFRKAITLQPADEFMNVNALTLFLGQWALLEGAEKEDVRRRLAVVLERNEGFLRKIRDLWKQTYRNLEGLRAIYAEDANIGPRLEAFAR